ncbi:MAG: hypothetical protein PHN84_02005 [Desulfuromonadaceae bacterium]|nr:hypothetical protein [Desulfuromonadaceae bacterium]MDD2856407.1 hypothetical protein [Desulfuromonadaceae bacterium]
MTDQDWQKIEDAQLWWNQFRKENANIISELARFAADRREHGTDTKNAFLNAVATACYSAFIFEGNADHRKKREDDRRYLEERDGAIKHIDAVIDFMKWHSKNDTGLLNSAMFALASSPKKQVDMLSKLKEALTTEVKCFMRPHSHQHGCFLYPDPLHGDHTATTHRMLAVNLIGLFRLFTNGKADAIRQQGWPMPTGGKPNHGLVNDIVDAVLNTVGMNSKEAEVSFKKHSPGLLIVSWEPF